MRSNAGQCDGECDGGEPTAAAERMRGNAGQCARECEGGESVALIKGIVTNICQCYGECDGGENIAASESAIADCFHPARNHDTMHRFFVPAYAEDCAPVSGRAEPFARVRLHRTFVHQGTSTIH